MRNDHIGFVVNKIFFSDHSFEKLYRQNNDRDIVILSKFFIENPLRLDPHEKNFFLIQNKTILNKDQILRWNCSKCFLF